MTKIVCCECRKPDDNMMLAVPRAGYADRRKAICTACYWYGVDPARHRELFLRRFDEATSEGELALLCVQPTTIDGDDTFRLRHDGRCAGGRYNRLRFRLVEMPSPIPADIVEAWGVPDSYNPWRRGGVEDASLSGADGETEELESRARRGADD